MKGCGNINQQKYPSASIALEIQKGTELCARVHECTHTCLRQPRIVLAELILFFLVILFYFLTSQYCIGFAIYQHESTTGIHVFPILNPPPSSLPVPSLWVVPVLQPQGSSIVHQTWTGDSFHIWYYNVSMPFSQIIPLILTWVLKINKKKCGLDKDFRAG